MHISGTVEASNLRFSTQIGRWGSKRYNAKLDQKGSCKGHVTYFSKFWHPLHILETVEARNFKFGTQIGH